MPKPKIDKLELAQMLRGGKTQREVAQKFGVSEAAVSKVKKELKLCVVKNVALESAHQMVEHNLDAVNQLKKINEKANLMLDELTGEDKLIDRMVKAVKGALAYQSEPQKQAEHLRKIVKQVAEDRFLALKAMAEIRGQLSLQLDVLRTMYDMEAVAEFQKEVLMAIGEVAPEVRRNIITRLKERHALRDSVSL